MRIQVVLICIFAVIFDANGFVRGRKFRPITVHPDSQGPIVYKPFQQILDHFGKSRPRFWTQRSWSNAEFVKSEDSPIFLYIGGEGPAESDELQSDSWYLWAEKYDAMMYQLEHRYYGESRPTKDASTKNLRYLSSNQAVEDLAYFIQETNKENGYTDKNKWIVFGGSYPGNLAAWSRLHHPELIHGAISSSAPLLAKANFFEYNDVVRFALNYFVPGCADEVTQAYKDIQKLMETDSGVQKVLDKFKFCSDGFDASNWLDTTNLLFYLSSDMREVVQYHGQNPFSIYGICDKYMMNETLGDPIDRLAALQNRGWSPDDDCIPVDNKEDNRYYIHASWSASVIEKGHRQWLYQTCNEFGYGKTSDKSDSLFSDTVPFQYFVEKCKGVFGKRFDENHMLEAVKKVNDFNQGTDIKVTNVVFVHGNVDPWNLLGVVKNPTDDDPYILINGTSHCVDMNFPKDNDNDSLIAAREVIDKYLKKWLSD